MVRERGGGGCLTLKPLTVEGLSKRIEENSSLNSYPML